MEIEKRIVTKEMRFPPLLETQGSISSVPYAHDEVLPILSDGVSTNTTTPTTYKITSKDLWWIVPLCVGGGIFLALYIEKLEKKRNNKKYQ